MTDLTLKVLPDPSYGTITVYADEGMDQLPYGHFESVLERLRGVERVRMRRYSIELDIAEHVTTVYRAGVDVIDALLAEAETLKLWDYVLVSVEPIYRTPKLGEK